MIVVVLPLELLAGMDRIDADLDRVDVSRICGLLESIAKRPGMSSEEIEALETAAIALMTVNSTRAMQRAYKKLADAHHGDIPEVVKADLRSHGTMLMLSS